MKSNNYEKIRVVSFARWLLRWRWLVLLCSVTVVILAAMSSKFIAFNSDQDIWFGENNPQLSAMNALEEKFSKDKNVFIAIEAKDGKIFSQETVTTIEELIADAWKLRK